MSTEKGLRWETHTGPMYVHASHELDKGDSQTPPPLSPFILVLSYVWLLWTYPSTFLSGMFDQVGALCLTSSSLRKEM